MRAPPHKFLLLFNAANAKTAVRSSHLNVSISEMSEQAQTHVLDGSVVCEKMFSPFHRQAHLPPSIPADLCTARIPHIATQNNGISHEFTRNFLYDLSHGQT